MRTQLVVALSAESRVRDDDRAKLWFDPSRMMIFDPESGENLTHDGEAARRIDEESEQDRRSSLERAHQREGRPKDVVA